METKPRQGYDLGDGYVTIGSKILYLPPGERAISGIVTDLTQDGDITIQPDKEQHRRFTTKWRYVIPRKD